MQVIKIILMVIYFIVCFALIVLAMMQSKEDVKVILEKESKKNGLLF